MEIEPNKNEQEQTPEEILEIITEAISNGREVLIEQRQSDGSVVENLALPFSIEDGCVLIEADGWGLNIILGNIKRVKVYKDIPPHNID
jgi:hypothetical protein